MKKNKMSVFGKIWFALLGLLVLFPFYWIAISSLKTSDTIIKPDLWPVSWTLKHYQQLLSTSTFVSGLRASLIVALGTIAILLVIVILASYGLYRFDFRGRELLNKVILLAYVFPGILLIVPVYNLMSSLNLIDSFWALIIMNVTFAAPFCTWLMRGFFASIPKSLDEAAMIDGASRAKIFWSITMPLSKPIIIQTLLSAFVGPWGDFMMASYIVGGSKGPQYQTVAVGLQSWIASEAMYSKHFTHFCAGGVVVSIIPIVLFFFMQRFYVEGVTGGSVKG